MPQCLLGLEMNFRKAKTEQQWRQWHETLNSTYNGTQFLISHKLDCSYTRLWIYLSGSSEETGISLVSTPWYKNSHSLAGVLHHIMSKDSFITSWVRTTFSKFSVELCNWGTGLCESDRCTRSCVVSLCTTELFLSDFLVGNRLDDIRSSDKQVGAVLDHEREVGQCWRADRTTSTRPHNERYLWNYARREHTGLESKTQ